jgi:hypothetical protein
MSFIFEIFQEIQKNSIDKIKFFSYNVFRKLRKEKKKTEREETEMSTITKGYKQGRAVTFYDISEDNGAVQEKVSKDSVVKLCEAGKISNAKVQWWQGNPIVRCSDNIPLAKIDTDGNIIGIANKTVRKPVEQIAVADRQSVNTVAQTETSATQQRTRVDTQSITRKAALTGYDPKHIREQRKAAMENSISDAKTLEDVFNYMADDFCVKYIDGYRKQLSSKMKLDREVANISTTELKQIEYMFATFLMNMKYEEVQESYIKYLM